MTYVLKYIDKGPIAKEQHGRIIELCAVYPDGRRLQVATFSGYQPSAESASLTLYPRRIHRPNLLPEDYIGKRKISISEVLKNGEI